MSSRAALEPDVIESQVPVVTGLEAQTRGEIDIQIATARRFPRSVTKAIQDAMSLATMNEEIAASCWYAKPQDGKTVEGPSARLAEIMASCWGHMRSEARIVEEAEKHIVARGTSWDLERNVAVAFEVRRRITKRDNKRYSDDMIVTASNAANSIAYRNTVFRVIPKAFWWPVYEAARKTAVGTAETLVNKRAKMIAFFAQMGVTEARLFAAVNVRGADDITLEHLTTLRGLANAIRDGEVTIEEAFPVEPKEPQRAAAPAAEPAQPAAAAAASPPASTPTDVASPATPIAPTTAGASVGAAADGSSLSTGVRIEDTKVVVNPKDPKDVHYEVYGKKNNALVCFITRDEALYKEAASCEGTDHLYSISFTRGRQGSTPIFIMNGLTLEEKDDATPNTGGSNG